MQRRMSWALATLCAVLAFYSWAGAMGREPGVDADPRESAAPAEPGMPGTSDDVHLSTPVTSPEARAEIREGLGISGRTSGTAAGSINSSGTGQNSGVGSNIGTGNGNRGE